MIQLQSDWMNISIAFIQFCICCRAEYMHGYLMNHLCDNKVISLKVALKQSIEATHNLLLYVATWQ